MWLPGLRVIIKGFLNDKKCEAASLITLKIVDKLIQKKDRYSTTYRYGIRQKNGIASSQNQ